MQAGATGVRPATGSPPSAALGCQPAYRIGVVSDVAGLGSSVDAQAWQGARDAARRLVCGRADLTMSRRPSEYRRNLQAYVDRGYQLVVAASFLLADDVADAAGANPGTRFVLVDPLVPVSPRANLAVLTFREDEAGFLAGALAGLTTRSGIVAGVYGLEDERDRRYRLGFERGARYSRPNIRALGAFQGPEDGSPYANPDWGAAQARVFLDQGADVIFAAGGLTAQGALRAAEGSGRACIGTATEADASGPADGCRLATAITHVDRAVGMTISDAAAGRWQSGPRSFGLAEGAIELSLGSTTAPDVRERINTIGNLLEHGMI